jgi:hypothetical protein
VQSIYGNTNACTIRDADHCDANVTSNSSDSRPDVNGTNGRTNEFANCSKLFRRSTQWTRNRRRLWWLTMQSMRGWRALH